MTKTQKAEIEESVAELRKLLKPGDTVYAVLRHVTASGMTRWIDCYMIQDGAPRYLTGYIAKACQFTRDRKHDGIKVGGCGMDMGFAVVYHLSRVLFPEGFIPAEYGLRGRNRTPDTERDTDGGYALKHPWL